MMSLPVYSYSSIIQKRPLLTAHMSTSSSRARRSGSICLVGLGVTGKVAAV